MMRLFLCLAVFWISACSNAATAEPNPPKITVDQFGYLPAFEKRAIIRDPQRGWDSDQSFQPGKRYAVINTANGKAVFEGEPIAWARGRTDPDSGDRIWVFDFTALQQEGRYVVRDLDRRVDSYPFEIKRDVYTPVLKIAFKTLYLQRAGFAKTPRYAGPWADGASHMQDGRATLFMRKGDKATSRDLRGGWYDAGDYNQYTSWTANYITQLLMMYAENPNVWTDDFDIPESGNGIPDILDEAKWGLDWLARMQNDDGSMLSILGRDQTSPPSKSGGPSYYGPPNTSATVTSAGAFALAAKIVPSGRQDYARRAVKAWDWAKANPKVIFKNNEPSYDSEGLGAGQQEVGPERLDKKWLMAASYMFAATGQTNYLKDVQRLYRRVRPMQADTPNGFEGDMGAALLYLAQQSGVPAGFSKKIKSDYVSGILNGHNGYPAVSEWRDPYGAYTDGYWWGSNRTKAQRGSVFTQAALKKIGDKSGLTYFNAGSHYLHYLHGVNPNNKVYLSNMGRYGAENSVNSFYHAWFKDGSKDFDDVRTSRFGPAPGFLVGGPHDGYERDSCCPNSCGRDGNRLCKIPVPEQLRGQPPAKSYVDFNEGWPLNSWAITENSHSYQMAYLRLLSKFAR